uniref:Uncharacterized protein n=1 Tax=Arundo donax TaxID=35708 RepID=A0A0A8YTE9_ARUDO
MASGLPSQKDNNSLLSHHLTPPGIAPPPNQTDTKPYPRRRVVCT